MRAGSAFRSSGIEFLQDGAQCFEARRGHLGQLGLAQRFEKETFQFQRLAALEIQQC